MMDSDGLANCWRAVSRQSLTEIVLLGLIIVLSASFLSWVLWSCYYGIDITDEGSYLQWIASPANYTASVTQYGFVYHPLYLLVHGDIALLRQANVLITYGLGWCLSYVIIDMVSPSPDHGNWRAIIISSALGTTSILGLIIAGSWMPTPSYNTLATQSLLLTAIGLCLAQASRSRTSLTGWAIIGLGGWLTFMAKPTTAAVLALCVLFYLLLSGKARIRLLFGLALFSVVLLLFSSLLIDGSVVRSLDRLAAGIHLTDLMGAGYTISELWRLEILQLGRLEQRWLFVFTSVLWMWLLCISSKYAIFRTIAATLAVLLCVASLSVIRESPLWRDDIGLLQDLTIWAIPAAVILYAATRLDKFPLLVLPLSSYPLLATFMVLPYAYAFGTNNNYWGSMPAASVFWVAGAVLMLCVAIPKQKLIAALGIVAIAAQSFVILRVHAGMENPYRQIQPLFINDYRVDIGRNASTLILEREYARYLTDSMSAMKGAGFEPGTPMIDLTGQSPGLLYAFGAEGVGQAWLIGGYPGSYDFVKKSLAMVSCFDLSRAWLLTEPSGPRSLSAEVLSSFGFAVEDYKFAAKWRTSPGSGGYSTMRTQIAWEPRRSASVRESECEGFRTAATSSRAHAR